MRRDKAMTMVEMVTVIAIIAVLAGILLPALSKARQTARETRAASDIHQLEVALRMYAEDCGLYPPDEGPADPPTGCNSLIDHLETRGVDPPYAQWPDNVKDSGNLLDPWGRPYRYRYDHGTVQGLSSGVAYNIWSFGPDGQNNNGGGDDIKNW